MIGIGRNINLLPGILCVSQVSCRVMHVGIEDKIWTWSAPCIRHYLVQTCFRCDAQHLSYVHRLKTCWWLYGMITSLGATALVLVNKISVDWQRSSDIMQNGKMETYTMNNLIAVKRLELAEISICCRVYHVSVKRHVEWCMSELRTRFGHEAQHVSDITWFKHVSDVMRNSFPMCIDWEHAGDCMARLAWVQLPLCWSLVSPNMSNLWNCVFLSLNSTTFTYPCYIESSVVRLFRLSLCTKSIIYFTMQSLTFEMWSTSHRVDTAFNFIFGWPLADYIYTWVKLHIYRVSLNQVFIYHVQCVYEMYNMESDALRSVQSMSEYTHHANFGIHVPYKSSRCRQWWTISIRQFSWFLYKQILWSGICVRETCRIVFNAFQPILDESKYILMTEIAHFNNFQDNYN